MLQCKSELRTCRSKLLARYKDGMVSTTRQLRTKDKGEGVKLKLDQIKFNGELGAGSELGVGAVLGAGLWSRAQDALSSTACLRPMHCFT